MDPKSITHAICVFLTTFAGTSMASCKSRSFHQEGRLSSTLNHQKDFDCGKSQILDSSHDGQIELVVSQAKVGSFQLRSMKIKSTGLNARELILDDNEKSSFPRGRSLFRKCYEPALELAFTQYRTRRGWNEDFIEKLRVAADRFSFISEYLLVYEETDPSTKQLVGTIRFITMPYLTYTHRLGGVVDGPREVITEKKVLTAQDLLQSQHTSLHEFALSQGRGARQISNSKIDQLLNLVRELPNRSGLSLPLESIDFDIGFGIGDAKCRLYQAKDNKTGKHCLSSGDLIEPGNLAVLKDKNAQVMPLLVELILMRMLRDDLSLPSIIANRKMLTYNDKIALYTRIGFKNANQTREKFGVSWILLEATMSRFIGHYHESLEAMQSTDSPPDLATVVDTSKGVAWRQDLKSRALGERHEPHRLFLSNLYESLESSFREKGNLKEVCGMVSTFLRKVETRSGETQVEEFILNELFNNKDYTLEFGDGASENMVRQHHELGTPICIIAYVEDNRPLTVHSVNWQRSWAEPDGSQ